MQAIVCVDNKWGIGYENRLLFHLRADLKRFRALTLGRTVIMGHQTLLSLPGGRPLPDRRNIVLTRHAIKIDGVEIVHSAKDACALAGDDAVVIGGASVYTALLPFCERVLVTKVFADPPADTFFPNLDSSPKWQIGSCGEVQEEDGVRFQYVDYIRR